MTTPIIGPKKTNFTVFQLSLRPVFGGGSGPINRLLAIYECRNYYMLDLLE